MNDTDIKANTDPQPPPGEALPSGTNAPSERPSVAANSAISDKPTPVSKVDIASASPPIMSQEEKRNSYNKLVRTAKLKTLLLHETEFSVHHEAHAIAKHLLEREVVGSREVLSSGCSEGDCVVRVKWTAITKYKKKKLVSGWASYIVNYQGMTGCTLETVEEFTEAVAKAATYPYFRSLYAHLDWSAELGSPPLPVFQFLPKLAKPN